MRSAVFWYFTQRRVVVSGRRFGTTYQSHLQGSSSSKRLLDPCTCATYPHLSQRLGMSGVVPPLYRMPSLLAQQFCFCVTPFGEETRQNLLERLRFVSNCVVFTEEVRGTRWRCWLRHRAISRKVSGSIPGGVIGIFH